MCTDRILSSQAHQSTSHRIWNLIASEPLALTLKTLFRQYRPLAEVETGRPDEFRPPETGTRRFSSLWLSILMRSEGNVLNLARYAYDALDVLQ